jgi:hypothetical protein
MTLIKYDIDTDLKIIQFLDESTNKTANISDLRTNIISYYPGLDNHLWHLEKWGMIADVKPQGNGKARKITLIKDYQDCKIKLIMLKVSLGQVNEYF